MSKKKIKSNEDLAREILAPIREDLIPGITTEARTKLYLTLFPKIMTALGEAYQVGWISGCRSGTEFPWTF